METEIKKIILLCNCAIGKCREIMLEAVEKLDQDEMTDKGRRDMFYIGIFFKNLKAELDGNELLLEDMDQSISADGEDEIEKAVLRIENILVGNEPVQTPISNQPAMNDMAEIAKMAGL